MLSYAKYEHEDSPHWVTLVHGAGGNSAIWYKQIRIFRKYYNILLVDLRGHGRSKNVDYSDRKKYTFKEVGDDIIEVLDHLNIRASHFIGISMGTIIIREIAERHPDRILSLVMGGAVMKINFRGQVLMRLGLMFQSVIPYLVLYDLYLYVIMPRKKHREGLISELNMSEKEFRRWFALTGEVNSILRKLRLSDCRKPILYIMGDEDYLFLPQVVELVEKHSLSELFVIPSCGHVVNVENPEVFNKQTMEFINRIPAAQEHSMSA